MAFVASFALLCHDARARARERERETERETDTSSFFRDDAFCVLSKREVKNIIIEREDDEKKMIERARNDGHFPEEYGLSISRLCQKEIERQRDRSHNRHKKRTIHSYLVFAGASRLDDAHFSWFRSHFVCVYVFRCV